MASPLLNLVKNLSEENCTCKYGHNGRQCETYGIKYKYYDYFLEYANFKDDLIEYKCLCCNKNYQHKFDEKLKERIFKTYKLSNNGNNRFILFMQKGDYTYDYMDDWKKFNET